MTKLESQFFREARGEGGKIYSAADVLVITKLISAN